MTGEFATLKQLAAQLPKGLRADWQGTNHYELQCAEDDFWWLELLGINFTADMPCDTETGKRLGLIMDIAAEVGRLKDAGIL